MSQVHDHDVLVERLDGIKGSDVNWRLRLAQASDNLALCKLFSSVSLGGDLELLQEREPDFFKLLSLHGGEYETCLLESERGELGGCGSGIALPGWLNGEEIMTGYLCDLRAAPGSRGVGALARSYGVFMEMMRERHGAEVFTTVIFDKNIRAINALSKGGLTEARESQPLYRPMTPFEMISAQFTRRKAPKLNSSGISVSDASERDRDELISFLLKGQKQRLLGWRASGEALEARWASWPDFSYDDFIIARDLSSDRIIGCFAPWNTKSFKRTQVLGYHGAMRWQKLAYNAAAKLRGWAPLPQAGEHFDFVFLTHLEISDDRPEIFSALLAHAYDKLAAQRLHFASAFVPRGSGLSESFKPYMIQRTAMTLYSVCDVNSRFAEMDLQTLRPGFEMALS